MGLLKRMRRDGLAVGYMKPVSVLAARTNETVIDEDAALIQQLFALDTPLDKMVPVPITPVLLDSVLRGQTPPSSYEQTIKSAYRSIAYEKDAVILEGSNHWADGALVDLTSDRVIDMLDAPGLLVTRYHSLHTVDAILTVQRYLGKRMLLGVLINNIEPPYMDDVRDRIVPFLESREIPVLGLLPNDRLLASVSVNELTEHLGGQLIGEPEWGEKMVFSLLVGSMGSESALAHLRRRPNKAVITGGDRIDVQLVALETSTSLLILTGNIQPSVQVINKAEEKQVPILVVAGDTLTSVERAEEMFGRVRFHQPAKFDRFVKLLDDHFNYERLYSMLKLEAKHS
jgi:hypothetical protein